MSTPRIAVPIFATALFALGCSGNTDDSSSDADATPEIGVDATSDSGADVTADAPHDAHADASTDASTDAIVDAIVDAKSEADAGADTPPSTLHCFSSPGSCGFPDPAFGNVGVPAGTSLTPSSSVTISTAGSTLENCDVTGAIVVTANDVTIRNCRVTVAAPGCGTATTCGNYAIKIETGVTGTVLSHLELTVASGGTVEHAVRNLGGSTTKADHLYIHGTDAGWWGAGTIDDSYMLAVLAIPSDHLENLYYGGGDSKLSLNHDTLFNPAVQTSTIFTKTDFGPVNKLTITNNLVAGGGYTLSGGEGGASSVVGPVTVTGNHFCRCGHGAEVSDGYGHWVCAGGPDSNGYYPRGGSYGPEAGFKASVTTWSDNVWDDDGTAVTGP